MSAETLSQVLERQERYSAWIIKVTSDYYAKKEKERADDGREHDATDDIPAFEESRRDYGPERVEPEEP
jgi:hypothetical protein